MDNVSEILRLENNESVGFADTYLTRCHTELESGDNIDIEFYTKLVKLDKRLGRKAVEQLSQCIHRTTRSDIIMVWIKTLSKKKAIILDERL